MIYLAYSIPVLLALVAAGTWLFNRRPMRTSDAEHREMMRRMVPPHK